MGDQTMTSRWTTSSLAAACAVVAAFLVTACSPAADEDQLPALPTASAPSPTSSCDPQLTSCRLVDENGTELRTVYPPSDKVKAMLADERVTREEYETAFSDYQACMKDHGLELYFVDTSSDIITFSSQVVAGDDESWCNETHYREVDAFWQVYERAPDDLTGLLAQLVACLDDVGVAVPHRDLPEARRDQRLLLDEIEDRVDDARGRGLMTDEQATACHA